MLLFKIVNNGLRTVGGPKCSSYVLLCAALFRGVGEFFRCNTRKDNRCTETRPLLSAPQAL